MSTELLGLAAAGVGDEQRLVVLDEELLHLALERLVFVLLGVRDDTLGNGLADRHDLRAGTTTADAHSNVEVGKLVLSEEEDGLAHLHSQRDGLHNVERLSIDTNISLAGGDPGDGGRVLLSAEGLNLLSILLS